MLEPAEAHVPPRSSGITRDLFRQHWWLEAVAPGQWAEATVVHQGSEIASLPYVASRRAGVRCILAPPLTPRLGPALDPGEGGPSRRLAREDELIGELLARLPKFDHFRQRCHPNFTNWLPLYWRGFNQTTLYSYVLHDLSSLEATWAGLESRTRRNIKSAEGSVSVRTDLDIDVLTGLVHATYDRQGARPPDLGVLRRTYEAVLERDAGQFLCAVDQAGKPHAGLLVVWDSQRAYYLLGGSDPSARHAGSMSLAVWHAIRGVSQRGLEFDFEGSMNPAIERFFRGFGALQEPYHDISRSGRLVTLASAVRQLVR